MDLIKHAQQATNGLKLSPEMYRQARGNKHHVVVSMRPEDFLKLTTRDDDYVDRIKNQCKKLDEYNQWTERGESILMPFLYVDSESGQITGHEGRHRAAALICAGSNEMPVSIRIGGSEKHKEKYGYFEATYDMKFEDLPEYIRGEYGRGILDTSRLRVLVDGWKKLRDYE